jgi:hypothetical protein
MYLFVGTVAMVSILSLFAVPLRLPSGKRYLVVLADAERGNEH